MKIISIVKIDKTNPVLKHYKKTINSWNKEHEFITDEEFLYGIFLEDKFIGASKITFNEETSTNEVLITNNKNYDFIFQEETIKQLIDSVLEEYDNQNMDINYVKKLGCYQKTTK